MIGEVFYWIFNMSIAASLTGLIVLLIGRIRRMPRRFYCLLWAAPFIRAVVPVGLGSRFSLMTLISKFTTRTVTVYVPQGEAFLLDPSFSLTNYVMAAKSYFPITYKVDLLAPVFRIAGAVWAAGAAGIIIALAILYFTSLREIRGAERIAEGVFVSPKVNSPAVYGIIKPRIVLPESMREAPDEYVLLHERTHIKRLDNLFRLLAFFAVSLHWFNPLAWVFLKAFLRDLELACDECAVRRLDDEGRRAYASALLEAGAGKTLFASAFGGAKVKTRIENVLSFKKTAAVSAVFFTALAAAIVAALILNAK
ncbi:MAG: peptidase M56 BlaR1 [Clostridiales bacterium]|nr:peptidase M56 BlaR1 [Clostridiales bacterium]